MLPFSPSEWEFVVNAKNRFWQWFEQGVIGPVYLQFKLHSASLLNQQNEPESIKRVRHSIGQIQTRANNSAADPQLPKTLLPILKAILIFDRRNTATAVERLRHITHNSTIRAELDKRLEALDAYIGQSWFLTTEPEHIPQITDFLTLQQIDSLPQFKEDKLADRVYDEKFHILYPQPLFFSDLDYYRRKCSLRSVPICIAFLDIDQFRDFNSRYTEPVVDRQILPLFMATLEAQIFNHGFAYRAGGDEYVMLLPNMTLDTAITFLRSLRQKLGEVDYPGVEKTDGASNPTVSIGLIAIERNTWLTNQEVLDKTALAKQAAKKAGRNRIAVYRGALFREEDVEIVPQP